MNKQILQIVGLLKANLVGKVKTVYKTRPLKIPESALPAIYVEFARDNVQISDSQTDRHDAEVIIGVAVRRRDGDIENVVDIMQGNDSSGDIVYPSVFGIMRYKNQADNITGGITFEARESSVDYQNETNLSDETTFCREAKFSLLFMDDVGTSSTTPFTPAPSTSIPERSVLFYSGGVIGGNGGFTYYNSPYTYLMLAESLASATPRFIMRGQTTPANGAGMVVSFQSKNAAGDYLDSAGINAGFETTTTGAEMGVLDVQIFRRDLSGNQHQEVIGFNANILGLAPSDANVYQWNLGSIAVSGQRWSGVYAKTINLGSGITASNSCAMIEMNSITQGFLQTRMTSGQKHSIANPVEGLSVYDTTAKKMSFYNGTNWENITSS